MIFRESLYYDYCGGSNRLQLIFLRVDIIIFNYGFIYAKACTPISQLNIMLVTRRKFNARVIDNIIHN